jgi:DNA primase
MTGYYDEHLLREIEMRLDIVDIVSETTSLSRKGNRYWGLCPFHQEKTPSFSVTPEKNMFYCFGCHAGGDLYSFVMRRDGLGFNEAVEMLAAKAGVELLSSRKDKKADKRKKVTEINKAAAEFYHDYLLGSRALAARKYLEKRGINNETIEEFNLGLAPDSWNNLENYLLKKGFSQEYVKLSGVIKRNEKRNTFYDLFRKRIIFPIYHYNGEIVGFGGRVLDDSLPKYLNTPETEIFSKRNTLFGLYQGKNAVRLLNEVIIVEGYLDCIKLQQAGIRNSVASLGTAFTREQARLLARYAEKAIIIFDGDEAGQRETMRTIDILVTEGLKTSVVTLPAENDPDEYIELLGKEEFLQYIKNNKLSYIEYKLNRYIKLEKELNLEARIRIIELLRDDIEGMDSELEKDYYVKILAQNLMIEENLILRELSTRNTLRKDIKKNKTRKIRDNIEYGNYSIQEKILGAMFKNLQVFEKIKATIGLSFFAQDEYKKLAKIYDEMEGSEEQRLEKISKIIGQGELTSCLARIMFLCQESKQVENREIEEFIRRVQQIRLKARWNKMFKQLEGLKADGDFYRLLNYILSLNTFLNRSQEGGIR